MIETATTDTGKVERMALTPPGAAAQALGVSDATLRQLAGDHYYGRWIEAESPGQGGRRGRMYTERDMALLRYVVRTEKRGTAHKRIKLDLEEYGIDTVLGAAMAAEEAVPVLSDEVTRLRLDVEKARGERDGLVRDKKALEAAMEQQRQQVQTRLAEAQAEADQAHSLHAQVRAGAMMIGRQVEVWLERVDTNRKSLRAARLKLADERSKITTSIRSANDRIGTLSGWLLHRGEIKASLREAGVRMERVEEAEHEIASVEDSMDQVTAELKGNLAVFTQIALLNAPQAEEEEVATTGMSE